MSSSPSATDAPLRAEARQIGRGPKASICGTGLELVTCQPRSDTLSTRLPQPPQLDGKTIEPARDDYQGKIAIVYFY
ncbi:hypothetical protein TNCV_4061271 [Trichonephila clavipes]|nr:hypothetical protein TNCV_4061271 [Trichonephila clavipes]